MKRWRIEYEGRECTCKCNSCEASFQTENQVAKHVLAEHLNIKSFKTNIGTFYRLKTKKDYNDFLKLCSDSSHYCYGCALDKSECKWSGPDWYICDVLGFAINCDARDEARIISREVYISKRIQECQRTLKDYDDTLKELELEEKKLREL